MRRFLMRSLVACLSFFIIGAACAHLGQIVPDSDSGSPGSATLVVAPLRGGRVFSELDWTGDQRLNEDDLAMMTKALRSLGGAGKKFHKSWLVPTLNRRGELGWTGSHFEGLDQYPLSPREIRYELEWLIAQTRLALKAQESSPTDSLTALLRPRFDRYLRSELNPAELCDTIESWVLSDLRADGFVPSAVFDLDGTLWRGHVIDGFLQILISEGMVRKEANEALIDGLVEAGIAPRDILEQNTPVDNAALLLNHSRSPEDGGLGGISRKDAFFLTARALRGLTQEEVVKAARRTMEQGAEGIAPWSKRLFAGSHQCGAVKLVQTLQKAGVQVVFLSATLAPLVKAAGDLLGVGHKDSLGSELVIKDGYYTGDVASTYAYKASIVRQHLPNPPILVLGDSARSDFPMMLESVGMVLMVNPGPGLLKKGAGDGHGQFTVLRFTDGG